MANTQKTSIASAFLENIKENGNFAIISFEKATHQTLEGLRKKLRAKETYLNVVKNTLFEKAVNKLSNENRQFNEVRKSFFPLQNRNILMTFKGDWSDALKEVAKFMKDNEAFSFKFGQIDATVYNQTDMVKLSQLPGRQELMGKLVGVMKNPMARTARALTFNMQKFVYILSEKAKQ